MEIHALKLVLTEADINTAVEQALPHDSQLGKVEVHLTTEGADVNGVYTLFIKVPFETRWELAVREGKLAARLVQLKVVGLGARMVKGILMNAISDVSKKEDALQVDGDTVLLDLDRLLARKGFITRTNLTAVKCGERQLQIEASSPV